jgi:5-methylcytosine-specific restriction protein A
MPQRPPIHRPYRQPHDDRRPSAHARGYDHRWRKYTKLFLSKPENAVCRGCTAEGRDVPATVVDHITPHRGDQRLFWSPRNHQPLCKPCHDHKTATEDGGFGRNRTRKEEK